MGRFDVVGRLVLSIVAMTGSLACVAGVKPGVDAGSLPTDRPADSGAARSDAGGQGLNDAATGSGDSAASCQNLCKRQMVCPGGGDTTLSGVVHAPTPARFGAADPLYNVLVYVPNAPVAKFAPGVACQPCERASGSPLVSAITGPDGKFQLRNVPVGANVPLVIQVGRWRRQVVVPTVAACTDTALPDELTRLPRNQQEGDIPAIAIATGTYDPFDCTLRKIGIDEAEFSVPTGTGRVNLWSFGGHGVAGTATPPAATLLTSRGELSKYDLLILPCNNNDNSDPIVQGNLADYANKGGRIFLTDLSNAWLQDGGTFQGTATPLLLPTALGNDFTATIDVSFPKGMAFSAWISGVGAARPMAGQIPVHDPFGGGSRVQSVIAPTQRWLHATDRRGMATVQTFTFNTPIGVPDAQQCGRVVFSQFHVASEANANIAVGAGSFPASCDNMPMTPQEKSLEFMLFDLSSCIQPDTAVPVVIF